MEADAAWVPYDFQFQLANWITEPAAAPWVHGFPVDYEYASTEISVVPSRQLQVEYSAAAAATTQSDGHQLEKASPQEFEAVDIHTIETKAQQSPIHEFEKTAQEFNVDIGMVEKKIHRYPTIIRALGASYTVPTMVAIGPYHHHRAQLRKAEKVKDVAAYHCIRESGRTVQEIYDAVAAAARGARVLYDKDVAAGVPDGDFLPMMFYDACFLVQYMVSCTDGFADMDESLGRFLGANDEEIFHDILLLENQVPWEVVRAVMGFRPVNLERMVSSLKGCLQDRKLPQEEHFVMDGSYEPPHLLGLLRYYIVGRRRSGGHLERLEETESISFSVSAIELAEIGISLKPANDTTELIHMGVKKKGNFFAELSLPPLSLNEARACWLVNMAALELCTTLSFLGGDDEESAVCSYLLLLAMLVERDEDVHELRRRHLLQGGGGLTNKEALRFFTSLQGLRLGSSYVRIMEEIEDYKAKKPVRTKVHAFVYKNMRIIVAVSSAMGALFGIVGALRATLKGRS